LAPSAPSISAAPRGGSGAVPPCQLRPLYHYFNGSGFAEAFRRWEGDVRQIELFAEHIIPAFR
jgi:hypothetical protein